MVKTKLGFLLLEIFLITLFFSAQSTAQKILSVLPEPKEYRILDGEIILGENQAIFKKYFNADESTSLVIDEIDNVYEKLYGKKFFVSNGMLEILVGIPSINKNFRKICELLKMVPGKEIGEEGYLLLTESNRIILSANDNKGLFYGLQTLKQLIKGSVESKSIPIVRIKDYPSFKLRAVMDDISRGPIPTMDFVKYQIRRLAELKINALSHYVEHVVKTKKHPSIAPDNGSFTIEEWKEISDFAKKYFITVVGSFQSFGHFQNILSNPEYADLGESGTLISPVKEESYQFLKDIYDEMIPAFDAPYFNINCDETFDLGKAESKNLVDSIGYDEAYLQHIKKLYSIVKSHGAKTLIWGDIFLQYPNLIKKLPKDIIIATWNYDDNESFENFIKPFKESGLDFIIAPGVLNSNRIFPNFHMAFGNIKKFTKEGFEAGAMGVWNCVWDDGGTALFSNDWFGVAYGAERSWNHNSDDSNFDSRYNLSIYSSSNNSLSKSIWKLNELIPLESTDGMTDKILFSKLVPDKGKSIKISLIDWQEVLDIINEAEKELGNSSLLFYEKDRNYIQFVIDLYKTLANERFTILQAADNYRNALDHYSSDSFEARRLILNALSGLDKIIHQVRNVKSDYEFLWLNENHTYALDRVSEGYQKKLNDYEEIKSLLLLSLKNLDSGKPLLPIEDVRLAITKLPGKYFREWMIVNPIPNKDRSKTSSVDYLVEMGGELNAQPKVAEEFYFDSTKYRWRRVVSDYPDIINLTEIFTDNNQNVVVYAFANINSEEESIVDALVSCDDGIEVIINGKSVYKNVSDPSHPGKEFQFQLPLKKGQNDLMLKISQVEGDWYFTFRLPNSKVRNNKNRYRIISGVQ